MSDALVWYTELMDEFIEDHLRLPNARESHELWVEAQGLGDGDVDVDALSEGEALDISVPPAVEPTVWVWWLTVVPASALFGWVVMWMSGIWEPLAAWFIAGCVVVIASAQEGSPIDRFWNGE